MRPDREMDIVKVWLICGVPLYMVSWYRFDAVAVFLTCVALVAYHEGRKGVAAVTAGFATRLWPLVLAVIPGIRGRRREVVTTLALATIVVGAWYAFSPSGFGDFLRYRQAKGYQIESVIGSIGLAFGKVPVFISGAFVVKLGAIDQLDKVFTVLWFGLVVWGTIRVRRNGRGSRASRRCARTGAARLDPHRLTAICDLGAAVRGARGASTGTGSSPGSSPRSACSRSSNSGCMPP